jgi:hypothetical protein
VPPQDPYAALAQPIAASGTSSADPYAAIAKPIEPGFLDKDIPLSGAWYNPTLSGIQSIGRGVRSAVQGVGQAIMHPVDTAEKTVDAVSALPSQVADIPAAIHDINQSPDPLGTYAKVAQDTAGQGAGQALTALATAGVAKGSKAVTGAALDALPSTERAGAALQDVKATAGSVPIDTTKVGNTALDIYTQSQRGATLPTSVNKLVRRLADPNAAPMTYEEAKDFQSNISKLSADEQMKLNPNTKRLVGQLNQDLKGSLQDAADTVGKGQQFQKAMTEYHNAMKLRGYSEDAITAAWRVALGATGTYTAAKIFGLAHPPKAVIPGQ